MIPTAALLVACAAAATTAVIAQAPPSERNVFHEVFVWNHVDFVWAHDSDKARALDARLFQPENCAVHALGVWRGRLFVTLPRWRAGVPATLAWLRADAPPHPPPPLQPFPSWEMQELRNCSALQSAQALRVTREGRLWVVDGGRASTLEPDARDAPCPPKILVYDLDERNVSASRLWKALPLPAHVLSRAGDSAFADVVVDADDVAYVSDASATEPGVVVVEARSGRAWKARDENSMRADAFAPRPPAGLPGGVTALALARSSLYFAPLQSVQVFAVDTAVLRDERLATGRALGERVRVVTTKRYPTQAMAADDAGAALYLDLNAAHAIARWDVAPGKLQVLASDEEHLQWLSAFALDDAGFLWAVSNRLRNFAERAVNVDEPNYRVLRAFVGGARDGAADGAAFPPTAPPGTASTDPFVLDVPCNRSQSECASYNYATHANKTVPPAHPAAKGGAGRLAALLSMSFVAAFGSLFA